MIDLNQYFCPNEHCQCYGLRSQDNLTTAGIYKKKEERKYLLKCKVCGQRFSETRNTIFFHSRYSSSTIKAIIGCVVEGNGVRSTARILNLSKDAVNQVILKAGEHADLIMSNLLRNLNLNECQMDELWSFVPKKTLSAEDLQNEYGQTWIWTAIDTESRLIICFCVGYRTLESFREFFHVFKQRVDNIPLVVSEELAHYKTLLKETYGNEVPRERTGKPGRPRKPVKVIDSKLDYAVVHKTRENGKVTKVEQRIVFGEEQRIKEKLSQSPSNKINTAYVERSNGTLRQMNGHLKRKSLNFAKEMPYFKARLSLIILFYNFIRPHGTLSKNEDKTGTPRTPALCAGGIDQNWTLDYTLHWPM